MAYAVASLVEIIQQYQHLLNLDAKPQTESFLKQARSFRDFLQTKSWIPDDVEIQLIDAAHEAEDVIEVVIRDQVLSNSPDGALPFKLAALVDKFESIKEVMLYGDGVDTTPLQLPVDNSPLDVSSLPKPNLNRQTNIIAIYEDEFQILKARITEGPSQLQIIRVCGIPGIGKRTLAQRLYNDYFVGNFFEISAFVTMSMEINMQVPLLNLLDGLGKLTDEMYQHTPDQLGVHLRKALRKKKYFIVVHDVWYHQVQIWNALIRFFPDDNVGGRVLLTAQGWIEDSLVKGEPHLMRFMTDSESWLLFCQKIFGQEHCPDELKPTGKIIVEKCKGVAHVVVLIAGFLATSEKTPTLWKLIATTLSQVLVNMTEYEVHRVVLYSIFKSLPNYLKPCLLYLGCFNECCDIQAWKIIKLWIAEGFVQQSKDYTLEDLAEAYLQILAEKFLFLVTQEKPNGKVQKFQIEPIVMISCLLITREDKFLSKAGADIMNDDSESSEDMYNVRRVSAYPLFKPTDKMELSPLTRSFLSTGRTSRRLASVFLGLCFLRVLDVFQLEFYQFPLEILQLVLLKYLAFSCHSNLPTSIADLRNMQTLIIRRQPSFRAFSLPSELWEMTQLRHVACKETFILYYPRNEKCSFVHRNLQTLSNMQLCGVTNEFLKKIPNIRKLGIFCNIAMHTVFDLACLDELEALKCSSDWSLASRNFLSYLTFPPSLIKLTLCLCRIPWGFMKVVGSLPNLQELKVQKSDFLGNDSVPTERAWEPAEGEFPQLLSLAMTDLDLVHWRAHSTHFPRLRHLIIQNCYAMVGIPSDIGDVQTLELIQVDKGSPLALVSAVKIKEMQESRGNKLLQVQIN